MSTWLSHYSPQLEAALAKKISCKIIMPTNGNTKMDSSLKILKKYPNFELKWISTEPEAGFSVWDKKEVLISTSAIDTPFPFPTLWSRNKAIVALSQNYFDLLWRESSI
jgi:hypothetical protein